jgi:hypothetical protein
MNGRKEIIISYDPVIEDCLLPVLFKELRDFKMMGRLSIREPPKEQPSILSLFGILWGGKPIKREAKL